MGVCGMGIFDDAEKLVGQNEVQDLTKDAENFADQETGNKFDSEIADAGNMLDNQIDQQTGQQQQ
jgi:hypothetical protein